MKNIRFSGHSKDQLSFRGTTEEEVIETIRTSEWKLNERGAFECKKSFVYEKEWNKVKYSRKNVRPIFKEKENEIVVVTVYTYYF